jgi:hypothetical protein
MSRRTTDHALSIFTEVNPFHSVMVQLRLEDGVMPSGKDMWAILEVVQSPRSITEPGLARLNLLG